MIKKVQQKERLLSWILLNFAISFMFCVFAPIDAYYANIDEFWFSLPQMMSVCGIVFLILFAILDLITLLFYRTRISDILFAAFTAMFFFFYIQGNFIPRNYGTLTGVDIDWNAYPGYAAASILLGGISLVLFVLLLKKFRKKLNTIGKLAAGLLLCMMAGTSVILMVQNGIPSKKDSAIVTDEALLELSSDRNVIVMILDSYDSEYFEHTLNEDPDGVAAIYEDFTWYKDTLSLYGLTFTSVPYLLTGKQYLNQEPYDDYIQEINTHNAIVQTLQDRQYEANAYTSPKFFSPDHIHFSNIIAGSYVFSNAETFAKTIFKLIGFYYAPHQLKCFFNINTEAFSACRKAKEQNLSDYNLDPINFADRLEKNGLSISKSGNLFKVIHLEGCHDPFTFDAKLKHDGGNYTAYDAAAGNNEIMRRYLQALKTAGVYDNAVIIVMADHGGLKTKFQQNPLFMVKNAHESHPFVVSDTEMTYEYFPNILKRLLNGESVDDALIRSFTPEYGKRRFLFYSPYTLSHGYLPPIQEYFCEGPVAEASSLIPSGTIYYAEQQYLYTLGKHLSFRSTTSYISEAYPYVKSGHGVEDDTGMKLREDFLMHFNIEEKGYDDLLVQFTLNANNPVPWVHKVTANQHPVNSIQQSEDLDTVLFVIPGEYVPGGELDLHFYLNEEESNDENGNTEVKVQDVIITSVPDSFRTASLQYITSQFYLGKNLSFPLQENLSGFSYAQDEFADNGGLEIIGEKAALHFILDEKFNNLLAKLKYQAPAAGVHVQFYANDTLIYEMDAAGTQTVTLSIPREAIPDEHTLDLRIELLNKTELSSETNTSGFILKYLLLDKDRQANR